MFLKWGRCLLGDFQSEVVSDHSSDFMLRCHIYRMDRRRRNFYKYLCLLCSLQISLTSFPKSPLITRFCNVVQLTPFIVFHSLRVVLVVSSGQPIHSDGFALLLDLYEIHDSPPVAKSKKLNTKLFGLCSDKSIISHWIILNRYLLFCVYCL